MELSELEPHSLGLASSRRSGCRRIPQQRDSVLAQRGPVAQTLECLYLRTAVDLLQFEARAGEGTEHWLSVSSEYHVD